MGGGVTTSGISMHIILVSTHMRYHYNADTCGFPLAYIAHNYTFIPRKDMFVCKRSVLAKPTKNVKRKGKVLAKTKITR